MGLVDVHDGHTFSGHTGIQHQERISDIFWISEAQSCSCPCSTTLNMRNQTMKKCWEHAKEVTEYAKPFQLRHSCFCGVGHKKQCGTVRALTNQPKKGSHIHAAVCAWFDQNNEARHRQVPELSETDLTNLTHRKDLTASGDRTQVSQDAGFLAEVGRRPILCDQNLKGRKIYTCLERARTSSRQSRFQSGVCSV